MSERFFCPEVAGSTILLTASEAHHLGHVMRAAVGDQVRVFDGKGHEYLCAIEKIDKKGVLLKILRECTRDCEGAIPLWIAAPLPKGERERFLVEKLTELGVTRFVPLLTERTIVRPERDAVARLTRYVIEASKQCGRNRLMDIVPPQPWREFLATVGPSPQKWLAHPLGSDQDPGRQRLSAGIGKILAEEPNPAGPVVAAVGPEGGFTPEEVHLALSGGWQQIDLGPRILRVETAAIALATLLGASRQITILVSSHTPASPSGRDPNL